MEVHALGTTRRTGSGSPSLSTACPGKHLRPHRRVATWGVVAVWSAVVWGLGGDNFIFEWSASALRPALQWWLPSASPELVSDLHLALRRLAHATEYGLLALLTHHALRSEHSGSRARSLAGTTPR